MATEGCSSSSVDSSEKQEVMKKANELLAQGKRNVVCGEVHKAISLFDEAVQMLAKEYGDLSLNCVDAYFSYGSALLELGRMETNVLGVALEGVDVDQKEDEAESEQFEKAPAEDGEEREKLRTEVYDAMAEGEREESINSANDKDVEADVVSTESTGDVNEKTDKKEDKKDKDSNETKSSAEEDTSVKDSEKFKKEMCGTPEAREQDAVTEEKKESTSDINGCGESDKMGSKGEDENEKTCAEKKTDGLVTVRDKEEEMSVDQEDLKTEEKETKASPAKVLCEVKQENKKEEKSDNKMVDENMPAIEDKENASTDIASANDKDHKKSEEERESGSEEKQTKAAGENDPEKENGKDDKEDGEEVGEVDGEEPGEEDQEVEGEEVEGEESQEGGESQDDEEEKDEDVPNFQLAWEYLDLAKVIYLKSEAKQDQLQAAECHIKLGEVSMETEQHATAAEDLQSALVIQQKFLSPEDRVIAETHYQLGLAYGLGKDFELSIQHYQQAIAVIEAKIASLHKIVEENEVDAENKENRETDALQKYKDEIKELQELIPEMRNKIEDTKTEAKDMEKMKDMAKEMLGLSGTSKGFGSPTKKTDSTKAGASGDVDENGEKKASDISSLVRKKRKPEEEVPTTDSIEVKKIKQDGDATATATNSTTEKEESTESKINGTAELKVNGVKEVTAKGDVNDTEMADATAASS